MIRRVDHWLGLNVFHPPIIAACQLTGVTQFAVYRYLWWGVALWLVYRHDADNWVMTALLVAWATVRTLSAGIAPDRPSEPSGFLRASFLTILLLSLPVALAGAPALAIQSIAVLFAEYALTIREIPPRKKREPKRTPARV